MRIARACFILAGISGVSAAGVVLAQTTYQNQYCFPTPVPWNSVFCGCPVANIANDLCASDVPVPGETTRTYYSCIDQAQMTCTAPHKFCGGKVWQCSCYTCEGSYNNGCTSQACNPTDKFGFCGQFWGCTTP